MLTLQRKDHTMSNRQNNNEALRLSLISLHKRGINMEMFMADPKSKKPDEEAKRVQRLTITLNVITATYYKLLTKKISRKEAQVAIDKSYEMYTNPSKATDWSDIEAL